MSSPAERLAQHYQLELSPQWRAWFNDDCRWLKLPGLMREYASPEQLCEPCPAVIWPGFMLPDTLPILGNEYGDWICARITSQNTLGELIFWYHGGGDWIPVGATLAEAILHDGVDQFRPLRTQMLRGATESRIDTLANVVLRFADDGFRQWLGANLPGEAEHQKVVSEMIEHLSGDGYHAALSLMKQHTWSLDAVTCDLLETLLQQPVQCLADRKLAEAADVAWFPDFLRILFDVESATPVQRERVMQADRNASRWPKQDWASAARLAQATLERRQDLGWAAAIAGWNCERQGESEQAVRFYLQGVQASAFTDQGVRFNSHADTDEYGKFSAARLAANTEYWDVESHAYPAIFVRERQRSLLEEVSDYWKNKAQAAEQRSQFDDAFRCYLRAGWDIGVSRLSDYASILSNLVKCARQQGWQSRALVAEVHLNCLQRRTGGR